jgi:hypothetical protein
VVEAPSRDREGEYVTFTEEIQQGGTQQSNYTGYYITSKQDDNSWKITDSHIEMQ